MQVTKDEIIEMVKATLKQMGIPPYSSPDEYARYKIDAPKREAFRKEFLLKRGIKDIPTESTYKNLLADNGIRYRTYDEFKAGAGYHPSVIDEKGVAHNRYAMLVKYGYIEPIGNESEFLLSRGYKWHPDLVEDDYLQNNLELELYWHEHGFVPRFIDPQGNPCGRFESLDKEGYVYPYVKEEPAIDWELKNILE